MHTIHLQKIPSTNTYAKERAKTFSPHEITCIYAEEQTEGKGRQQKKWFSPPGVNLYITFFFKLPSATPHLTSIGQVLAASLIKILQPLDLLAEMKWPNDLYLHGKKFAGILCETLFENTSVDLILGIGVNVNMDKELLSRIDQAATSLQIEKGKPLDKELVLQNLQKQFASDLELFKAQGFLPFQTFLNERLAFKNKPVRCFNGEESFEGICQSLAPDGRLNLLLPNGQIKPLLSGDMSLRDRL